MFERFTDAARQVVTLAGEEARRLEHTCVGTEHLLLGLIVERDGVAARSFARLGVSLDAAREQVAAEVPPVAEKPGPMLPFTPRAQGTLDASLRQALGLKDSEVDTEHILLALLIERDARTASILASLGCPSDLLRTTVFEESTGTNPEDDGAALLALAEGSGVAALALEELGVTPDALKAAVDRVRGS